MIVAAIVAMNEARVIGAKGDLLWHLPEDQRHFRALTLGGRVVMGRKTYFSLPARFRPLPKRKNIVVTRSPAAVVIPREVEKWSDPLACVGFYRDSAGIPAAERLWIMGGGEIYLMTQPLWDEVYVTRVPGIEEGDAYFPRFEDDFHLVSQKKGECCVFEVWQRAAETLGRLPSGSGSVPFGGDLLGSRPSCSREGLLAVGALKSMPAEARGQCPRGTGRLV